MKKRITPEYYERHNVCPQCGGKDVEMTCLGCIFEPDTNQCHCKCGWRGICHDLVPVLAAGESDEK